MAYNLIDERWIPVERKSGRVEMIAPAQIAEREDPPLRVASPRPDFDGALTEFLIGLLQTASAPSSERSWESEFSNPPSVDALKKRFDAVRSAFFLDGDGPRFMQDLTVASDPDVEQEPIGALLIDRIGESKLSEGPSLFAKPALFESLGYPAIAAALMTMQSYAPGGGRGHRTSLRGGGPLTTIVLGGDLWSTAWLNVLPADELELRVPGEGNESPFAWTRPTRTSETGSKPTISEQIPRLEHYWSLPRRFRVDFGEGSPAVCSVYGGAAAPVAKNFVSRPSGTNYKGDFRHPLTAYSLSKPGEPLNPKKGSADGLPYRDWPLLVTGIPGKRIPATVVAHFARSLRRRGKVDNPRVAAFGFAMENMKPLRWCRAEPPLIAVTAGEPAERFAESVAALVDVSEEVRSSLAGRVKAGWSDRPQELDVFAIVNPAFWSRTEAAFFTAVHALQRGIEAGDAQLQDSAKETWLVELQREALAIFDQFVEPSAELATSDLRRAIAARAELVRLTSPRSRKRRELLSLPVQQSEDAVNLRTGKDKKGTSKKSGPRKDSAKKARKGTKP